VTQQNASASEQMSATSEELAAQAEQLQASIAYFRVEDGAKATPAAAPRRAVVGTAPRRPAQPIAVAKPVKQAAAKPVPARNGHDKSKANGFAIDLTSGGADARDAEFERM
jgi:methyl-accepting chemotaxis protein